MNASEKPRWFGISMISSEALVGIGITVAELGVLCLLLGWAEHMRSVPAVAWIWLALGAVLVIAGGLTAVAPRFRDGQGTRADRVLPSGGPRDDAHSSPEPEEQLY